MKEYALYFMPDISGFTDFVTSTEIEHSKHIISELLEILIDANYINLELVEIEGDALFMYTKDFPEFSDLLGQSKKMLDAFSQHIQQYNTNRICECGACVSAQDLQIKFLIHYGEISLMRVKDIVKPYGADVIKIHRLLKNSIPSDQYLLISQVTLDFYNREKDTIPEFRSNQDVYDYGTLAYAYTELESRVELKNYETKITVKPNRNPEIHFEIAVRNDVDTAIAYISDLRRRSEWYTLVNSLEFDDLRINQAGAVHQCIVGTNLFNVETIKWELNEGDRGYGERTFDMPNITTYQHYLTLNQNQDKVHIKLEVFMDFDEEFDNRSEVIMDFMNPWVKSLDSLKSKLNTEAY